MEVATSRVPYDVSARFCGKATFVTLTTISTRAMELGLLVTGGLSVILVQSQRRH